MPSPQTGIGGSSHLSVKLWFREGRGSDRSGRWGWGRELRAGRRGRGGEEEAVTRQKYPGIGGGLERHTEASSRGACPPLWSAPFL